MSDSLTSEEEHCLHDLLADQRRGVRTLRISANLFLVFGGMLLISTAVYLLQNRSDTAVYFVGVPNFVGGILLILAHQFMSKRSAQIAKLTTILSKLSHARN